jgi:mono/diheme cytochrome c family protein
VLLLLLVLLPALVPLGCGDGVPRGRLESAAARGAGRDLFVVNCATCHGKAADGKGFRAPALVTPPTDFTDPEWRAEATPESVYRAIHEGSEGTAMPAWPMFTEEETWNLVAYLLSVEEGGAEGAGAGG